MQPLPGGFQAAVSRSRASRRGLAGAGGAVAGAGAGRGRGAGGGRWCAPLVVRGRRGLRGRPSPGPAAVAGRGRPGRACFRGRRWFLWPVAWSSAPSGFGLPAPSGWSSAGCGVGVAWVVSQTVVSWSAPASRSAGHHRGQPASQAAASAAGRSGTRPGRPPLGGSGRSSTDRGPAQVVQVDVPVRCGGWPSRPGIICRRSAAGCSSALVRRCARSGIFGPAFCPTRPTTSARAPRGQVRVQPPAPTWCQPQRASSTVAPVGLVGRGRALRASRARSADPRRPARRSRSVASAERRCAIAGPGRVRAARRRSRCPAGAAGARRRAGDAGPRRSGEARPTLGGRRQDPRGRRWLGSAAADQRGGCAAVPGCAHPGVEPAAPGGGGAARGRERGRSDGGGTGRRRERPGDGRRRGDAGGRAGGRGREGGRRGGGGGTG